MAIISMSQKTLAEVAKSTIMIKEKMLVRNIYIMRYHQDFDNE
jgi:hypothetical protein